MDAIVEKVTAFVTRQIGEHCDLLLFEHPYAGTQIPAGTVQAHETPQRAVLREATEETGLKGLALRRSLGFEERQLDKGQRMVVHWTKVYARPDRTSFNWAHLPAGITVRALRRSEGFVQVTYTEPDRVPDSRYSTMVITGWVPAVSLASTVRRHFFHLEYAGASAQQWTVDIDNHTFMLFWAPVDDLPEIISPQDRWLHEFWTESQGDSR